jgi:hypothetical protein
MKIYTMEECMQWLEYRQVYYQVGKQLFFIPKYKNEKGNMIEAAIDLVIDCDRKSFGHNVKQIEEGVAQLCKNYPKLENIIAGEFPIFLAPKFPAGGTNGYANQSCVCLWAKPTQIPPAMTDYIVGHEFGHVVQFTYFDKYGSDEKQAIMREYLTLRNAPRGMCHIYEGYDKETDTQIYEDREDFLWWEGTNEEKKTEWDTSPYEWFAEDFRYFFGIDKVNFWIHPIPPPDERIKDFILSLGR